MSTVVWPFPPADDHEELLKALLPDIRDAVRAACLHYCADQSEIEHFSNEVVLLLIENDYHGLRSFRRESSRHTWLTAIARHYVSSHLSRERKAISLDEIPPELLVFNPVQENELIAEGQRCELREAVGQLTAREQQLFELLCRDDLTSADIAMNMGIKEDSVRRRKHTLIKKLRAIVNSSSSGKKHRSEK